jgi:hypothetical protein
VDTWKGRTVGGALSHGTRRLEKQYLSYIPCSKIIIVIIMGQNGRKCEKEASKITDISVTFSSPKRIRVNFRSQKERKRLKRRK